MVKPTSLHGRSVMDSGPLNCLNGHGEPLVRTGSCNKLGSILDWRNIVPSLRFDGNRHLLCVCTRKTMWILLHSADTDLRELINLNAVPGFSMRCRW